MTALFWPGLCHSAKTVTLTVTCYPNFKNLYQVKYHGAQCPRSRNYSRRTQMNNPMRDKMRSPAWRVNAFFAQVSCARVVCFYSECKF